MTDKEGRRMTVGDWWKKEKKEAKLLCDQVAVTEMRLKNPSSTCADAPQNKVDEEGRWNTSDCCPVQTVEPEWTSVL